MIREFWVKNYLSIRDKQELNFVAKGPSSELVTEIADGVFLYKLGILYGSNASGKSNMLIAMNELFRLLVMPKSAATIGIGGCITFALTIDEPTEMHVSFYADGTRYGYDVKFNDKHILRIRDEWKKLGFRHSEMTDIKKKCTIFNSLSIFRRENFFTS